MTPLDKAALAARKAANGDLGYAQSRSVAEAVLLAIRPEGGGFVSEIFAVLIRKYIDTILADGGE